MENDDDSATGIGVQNKDRVSDTRQKNKLSELEPNDKPRLVKG